MNSSDLDSLLKVIRQCDECEDLPMGPRPILAAKEEAKILILGQAPGRAVHESGKPWDDPSGERLREWMGIDRETFYDPTIVAIVPLGFCYPGKGKTGDLPPRKECAKLWHHQLIPMLTNIKLTLLAGQYAQNYRLGKQKKKTLTQTVKDWREYTPKNLPLPHPSPLNNRWLAKNPWFDSDVLPYLKRRVRRLVA